MENITIDYLRQRIKIVGECWIWQINITLKGYGQIKLRKNTAWPTKNVAAHRASYILHNGPIPDGLQVCHKCDTPACINPAHLFLGTSKDNALDCLNKGRHYLASLTICKRGHAFSPENTRIVASTGKRLCKECARQRSIKDKAKARNRP